MLLHKKIIYRRYCAGSVFILIFVCYFVIYENLPETSSRLNRNRESLEETDLYSQMKAPLTHENIVDRLSIIILEFEEFENVLSNTVDSIQSALGKVPIFIVADHQPYPPVTFNLSSGVKVITLSSDLTKNYTSLCPMQFFATQYIFIIPDGVTLRNWKQVEDIIEFLHLNDKTKAVAVPIKNMKLECESLNVDLKQWSVSFHEHYIDKFECSLFRGSHGLLMETKFLKSLAVPFARPFPFTFYVQAKLNDWKVRLTYSVLMDVLSELYQEPHSNWKHKKAEADRLSLFYKSVGIKRETSVTGVDHFYGCSKDTTRCFGTVINNMPDYLYLGRWTPPCCLKALRETAQHVISVLELCNVRYWLEGGSLLGAARHHDIIPWDYDVDIGIYREDVEKCAPLRHAREERYVDEKEFVWENATEGDFFRVQYSDSNHLHVDIFPFYSKNGVMTKNTWFLTHKQDREFPEIFLQPLTRIEFAGIMASAPNNVKEFLEYKFGPDVIEKPQYPNLQVPL